MATVPYPKNWITGEVLTAADLNAEFAAVGNISGIAGSQLLPQAIDTAQVKDSAVTAAKVADGVLGAAKIADGATNVQYIQSAVSAQTLVGTSATTLQSQAITMARTRCRIHVDVGGSGTFSAPGSFAITMKILRDATIIYTGPSVAMNAQDIATTLPLGMSGYAVDTTSAG